MGVLGRHLEMAQPPGHARRADQGWLGDLRGYRLQAEGKKFAYKMVFQGLDARGELSVLGLPWCIWGVHRLEGVQDGGGVQVGWQLFNSAGRSAGTIFERGGC